MTDAAGTQPAVATERRPAAPAYRATVPRRAASLRVNFAWTLAGNTVYAASQWAMLVVVARLSNPVAVGELALGFAVTAPVFLFCGLQLRAVQTTDAASDFCFADYLGLTIAGMVVGLAATLVVVLASGHGGKAAAVVLTVGACKAIEGVTEIHYGQLQRDERMRPIALSLIARGLLGIGAMALVLWATGDLRWAVVALALAWSAVLLLQTVGPTAARPRGGGGFAPRFDPATLRRLVVLALPLGAVIMLVSLRTNIPRYAVQGTVGAAELGVFAALSSVVLAGNLVVNALAQSAIPRLARHAHDRDVRAFRALLARLLAIAAALGAVGVLAATAIGRPLLGVLFGPAYAARSNVLVWLMVAGAVSYGSAFLGTALTATRRFRVQLPLFAGTSLVTAALCWSLVPRAGLVGAAIAWGAALLAELVAMAVVLERTLRRMGADGSAP